MTPEQRARDMLERLEHPRAQELSAGDVVELANLIAERDVLNLVLHTLSQYANHPPTCPKGTGIGYYKPEANAICICGIDAARALIPKEPQ